MIKISYPDREVYHHGSIFDGTKPFHAPAYTTDMGTSVPIHYWGSRVVDFKAPVTIKRSPADLVAANLMFPFGDSGARINTVPTYTFAGPMDNAGVTKYMPTTGERPDIGMVCDPSALFMLTGKPESMLAWARANDSFPHHFRDETTGKPIDVLKYPQANCADLPGLQGGPFLPKGEPDLRAPAYTAWGGGLAPQQAHMCEFGAYLAYMATKQTHFLENVQYNATFVIVCDAAKSNSTRAILSGEYRGVSWAFRNLFMAHAATLDAEKLSILPNSCHPSSYWKKILDNQLAYYSQNMTPANDAFRLVTGVGRFGPWQVDYMLTALAFGILTGHSDWAPLYLWALKNVIDRTSGKSGFPVGWGTPYYLQPYPHKLDANGKVINDTLDTSKPQFGWYEAFLYSKDDPQAPGSGPTQAKIDVLKLDPFNGGKSMQGHEYNMTTRAALVMAQYLNAKGIVDVKAVYPDLDLCVANIDRMTRANNAMNARVSVVLDASGVPSELPPPPVTQPPTEIPPVSNPGNDPLAPLKAAADSLVAIVPQVQAAVDNLEAQIAALQAAAASGATVPSADISAIVAKLKGVQTGLAAAVTDAATPG